MRSRAATRPKNLSNFANQLWHSDSSFMKPRAAYSMLHAVITPSWGGNTEFADLRAACDTLDERTRREVEGLSAEHYALHTRLLLGDEAYTDAQKKEIEPAVWPLVDTHPGSGRKLLFVGVHARRIVGWPTAEARMFLLDLLEHATRRERVYVHEWQPGDLVIWDNRSTLHRGRRYDIAERRELRRTTINATPEAMLDAALKEAAFKTPLESGARVSARSCHMRIRSGMSSDDIGVRHCRRQTGCRTPFSVGSRALRPKAWRRNERHESPRGLAGAPSRSLPCWPRAAAATTIRRRQPRPRQRRRSAARNSPAWRSPRLRSVCRRAAAP